MVHFRMMSEKVSALVREGDVDGLRRLREGQHIQDLEVVVSEAVLEGKTDVLEWALNEYAPVNRFVLYEAAKGGSTETIRVLLDNEKKLKRPVMETETEANGREKRVKTEARLPNEGFQRDKMCVYYALQRRNLSAVAVLVEAGCPLDKEHRRLATSMNDAEGLALLDRLQCPRVNRD